MDFFRMDELTKKPLYEVFTYWTYRLDYDEFQRQVAKHKAHG